MHRYGYILLLFIIVNSCTPKEDPVPQTGVPVFSISGNINETPITLSAGVNGYYMSTNYDVQPNGLLVFKGELSKVNCANCGPSISISLHNYTLGNVFNIDSADLAGDYLYYNQQNKIDTSYKLLCTSAAEGVGTPNIAWDFGSNRFSTESNPVVLFKSPGIYPITSSAIFPSNGCVSVLNQPIYISPTRIGPSADFTVNYLDSHVLLLNSIPVNNNAKVTWDFGDGQQGSGVITQHKYALSGQYKICMEYINGSDTMNFCKNVNTLDWTKCKANFTFNTKMIIDSMHLSNVVVEWKDEQGISYSSVNCTQPNSSSFKIIDATDYSINEHGQKTRKLNIVFTCTVSNGISTIELKNIQGTFAYAYP